MARRRRKRTGFRVFAGLLVVGGAAAGAWWIFWGADALPGDDGLLALAPALTSDRPEVVSPNGPRPGVTEKGATPERDTASNTSASRAVRAESLIAAGDQALSHEDPLAARAHLSEAMALGLEEPELSRIRAELTKLSRDTILSPRILENDPLVERYIIQPGDVLARIAHANQVSADLLAKINGIADKNLIRVGQTIKVVKGPFRAEIDREAYSLDVYLESTFIAHYRVGLGADGSTPAGEWRVKNKLENPTYYPPRGGRIIAADDPENPLGERWIGLEGIAGEAVGQQRYGIHGTIEPESIGQNSSMGCIRLFNEDVEELFAYMVIRHSTVTIR